MKEGGSNLRETAHHVTKFYENDGTRCASPDYNIA